MKLLLRFLLLLCGILLSLHTGSARTKPFFIDDDNMDDLMGPQYRSTKQMQEERDTDVEAVENNRVLEVSEEVACAPLPVPVRITAPSQFVITPTYVTLNRCLGPGATSVQKCAAIKREKVIVKYKRLFFSNQAQTQSVVMYDDLSCGSTCIIKENECNTRTQFFKNCICNCILNSTYCNSIGRHFNPNKCSCECKIPGNCPLYTEWNPDKCECECAKCIRDICEKAQLPLDSEKCKCKTNAFALSLT